MSVGGLLDLEKDRHNLARIILKKVQSLVIGRERICDRSREGRVSNRREATMKGRVRNMREVGKKEKP